MKYRLKCIHRLPAGPARRQEFASGTDGAQTRNQLMAELGVLNDQLVNGLQEFESTFSTPFQYRNVRINVLKTDLRKMPEIAHALNALAIDPQAAKAVDEALEGHRTLKISIIFHSIVLIHCFLRIKFFFFRSFSHAHISHNNEMKILFTSQGYYY